MRNRRRRIAANRLGRVGEFAAIALLFAKGYQILARNLRTPVGEIDIVARRGRVLVFIEVKSRTATADLDALGPVQRRRLVRAAEAFRGMRPRLRPLDVRFDLVLAGPWRLPRHVPDAWRPDR
jgi:putative endonuclease